MKGDMEVEILTEPSDMGQALRRKERIMMDADEAKLYVCSPNAARGNKRPGYMVDDDSGYGDTQ